MAHKLNFDFRFVTPSCTDRDGHFLFQDAPQGIYYQFTFYWLILSRTIVGIYIAKFSRNFFVTKTQDQSLLTGPIPTWERIHECQPQM